MISLSLLPHYQAYGLSFASNFPLPELSLVARNKATEVEMMPDVVIELGPTLSLQSVEAATAEGASLENTLSFSPRRSQLLFVDVGRYTVTEGRHILVEPLEGLSSSALRLPLLGSILALLLEQRGMFVLHAGALDFGTCAAAFLGEKGQGKSTLNAALSQAGYPLLSDDVVALSWPEAADSPATDFPTVLPGFAQIKLAPDAVQAVLGGQSGDLPSVAPELEGTFHKRSFMAPLSTRALPLRHLFVLSSLDEPEMDGGPNGEADRVAVDEDIRLRALSPQEAFIRLMPHTFGARFGEMYLQGERRTTHFRGCARLVRECRVWELARRRDLRLLPATIATIARAVAEAPLENEAPLESLA